MKFSDREARRRARYEELIAKYPGEVELYNRLIEDARGDPIWYPALQERFRMKAAQKSDDPSALYVAGLALFATDTPESIRLLEAAKAKAPQFPGRHSCLPGFIQAGRESISRNRLRTCRRSSRCVPTRRTNGLKGFSARIQACN